MVMNHSAWAPKQTQAVITHREPATEFHSVLPIPLNDQPSTNCVSLLSISVQASSFNSLYRLAVASLAATRTLRLIASQPSSWGKNTDIGNHNRRQVKRLIGNPATDSNNHNNHNQNKRVPILSPWSRVIHNDPTSFSERLIDSNVSSRNASRASNFLNLYFSTGNGFNPDILERYRSN